MKPALRSIAPIPPGFMTHLSQGLAVLVSAVATCAVVSWPGVARSHGVTTDYGLNLFTNELNLTATYGTGEPMQGATVKIYAPDQPDTPWMETTTDDQGRFSFLPDSKLEGEWKVEIEQEGHEDILYVPVDQGGVEFNNISQGIGRDVHYGVMPTVPQESQLWAWTAGSFALGLGTIAAGMALHRLTQPKE